MSTKVCKKCQEIKNICEFGISKRHKDGLLNSCKMCCREQRKLYFEKNPEAKKKKQEREYNWKIKNKKRKLQLDKEYRVRNKESIKKRQKDYIKNNPEKIKIAKKKYENKNPHIRAKIKTKRRQKERQSIPKWSESDKINIVYKKAKWLESLTGLKYHVDHIIPIQGENVCGLHVWANLQILEASINCSKGNKHE